MAALNFTTADQPNTSDGHTERAVFAARPVAAGELLLTEQPFASRHMHSLSLSLNSHRSLHFDFIEPHRTWGADRSSCPELYKVFNICDSGGNYRLHSLSVT